MFYTIISGLNFLCPKYTRKTEGGQTFTCRTIAEWNAFDPTIRKKPSIASFKKEQIKLTIFRGRTPSCIFTDVVYILSAKVAATRKR